MALEAGTTLGSRFRSLRDEVADNLRERIIEGELPPGQRLVERDLSDELEVSRITIREAFQTLAVEGLVTQHARRGASVTPFGRDEIRNLLELREPLEGLAARLAAVRHTERDGDQLRSTLTDSRRLLEVRDSRGASAANLAFHEAVGQASGNPLLLANIVGLHSQLRRLFRTTPQLQRDHVDEHELILDAILARDPGRAEALSRSHLQSATAATMALFEG